MSIALGRDNTPLSRARIGELEAVADRTRDFIEDAKAANTRRAYASDWHHFSAWCDRYNISPLPAEPETLALYLSAHAGVLKVSTLRRRRSAITAVHQAHGHTSPTSHHAVEDVWSGIKRTQDTSVRRKAPARTIELRAMVATLDLDRLLGVRDRAILVVGFAGAFRRSEISATDVDHVTEQADGLAHVLPSSKGNQDGEPEQVGLPYGSDPLTCPVRAWSDWLTASRITEGPAYRPITRHGHMSDQRLSASAVALVVKRTAEAAGLDPDLFAAHSLRAGLITSAAEADVLERDIMRQSRHKSIPVMRTYIRGATLFKDNAAAKVGL